MSMDNYIDSYKTRNGVSLDEFYANLIVGTTYRVRAVGMIYQNGTFVEQVSAISPEQTR